MVAGLPEYVALGDLARRLDTTVRQLKRLSRDGQFPPILKLGERSLRVRRNLFEQWLLKKEEQAADAGRQAALRADFIRGQSELPDFLRRRRSGVG